MAKVYQFPTHREDQKRKEKQRGKGNLFSPEYSMLKSMMESLIITYEEKIKELESYKQELKALDGLSLKTPKEVLKEVKILQKRFLEYGLSCNFFKFFTKNDIQILYYNDASTIYVIKNNNLKEATSLTVGTFIQEFEGYPFSLCIEEAILEIFDNQMKELEITVKTLKNTEI